MNNEIEILLQKCKDMESQNANVEEILQFLRSVGCSKITSMIILMDLKNISLTKAKEIVHLSKTWNDVRVRDNKTHGLLEDIANEIQGTSNEEKSE